MMGANGVLAAGILHPPHHTQITGQICVPVMPWVVFKREFGIPVRMSLAWVQRAS